MSEPDGNPIPFIFIREQGGDPVDETWKWIANNGFAAAIAIFLLTKHTAALNKLTEAIDAIRQQVSECPKRS